MRTRKSLPSGHVQVVAVGSQNPVKIAAVQQAFAAVFPEVTWEVQGVAVPSGVGAQPMSDAESITGARNRATRAQALLSAAYGVGLEGGLQEIEGMWFDCGWIVVVGQHGEEGIGSTIRLPVPTPIMQHIFQGVELGDVIDLVFQRQNSKQNEGHFGLMTKNVVTRTSGYKDGVVAALSRFVHPALFTGAK